MPRMDSAERLLYGVTRLALARGDAGLAALLVECTVRVSAWDEWTDEVVLYVPPEAHRIFINDWVGISEVGSDEPYQPTVHQGGHIQHYRGLAGATQGPD